ncbi:MAG TPA: cytochrome c [Steroidobacteraceae bacterium]|jgi:cytochrome c553
MIRILGFVAVLAVTLTTSGNTHAAGDPAAGKAKSATCGACHGPSGISTNDAWPSIAGQKQAYMVTQLKAFRDGTRADPVMSPLAKPLSDRDIQDLAAFFSRLNPVRAVY